MVLLLTTARQTLLSAKTKHTTHYWTLEREHTRHVAMLIFVAVLSVTCGMIPRICSAMGRTIVLFTIPVGGPTAANWRRFGALLDAKAVGRDSLGGAIPTSRRQ